MNIALFLIALYGAFAYLIGALIFFGAKADPWSNDKAFAFAVLWPLCVIYVICRSLIHGIVKLVKDEVL